MTQALEMGALVLGLVVAILVVAAVVIVRVLKEAVGCLRTLIGVPEPQEGAQVPLAPTSADGPEGEVLPLPPWETWGGGSSGGAA